jgi:ABC-2 type transport system ATP-binding protein
VLGFDPITQGSQLRRHTGVLTETPSLDERLTGYQNLTVYADLFGVPSHEVDGRIVGLLDLFGLLERSQDKAGTYSGGMKQRLALARALLHRPQILFLDEPASGLDPAATRRLHTLIVRLSRQERCTVFLCTHNLAEAQELCDRVAVLQQGRLLALGTPHELAQQVIQGRQLQIETDADHVREAQRVIEAMPQLGKINHDGKMISVTNVEHSQIPHIAQALVMADVPVYQIRAQEATLEDVYFALHQQEGERS